jgi:hypothetical protein
MNSLIFSLAILFFQDIPLKPKEEFEIKLDYQFKQRPQGDPNTVQLGVSPRPYDKSGSGVLPYLILNIKVLQLRDEKMRMRITNNRSERPIIKKVSVNSEVGLDLGFTVDMKDRVTASVYTLTFIAEDKNPVDRILISVDEDGSFFVNEEKRGKF